MARILGICEISEQQAKGARILFYMGILSIVESTYLDFDVRILKITYCLR